MARAEGGRIERAVQLFVGGSSCAQALLSVYGPDFGLDRELALKVAAPFGGGVSRTGGMCGAATGAILVLGVARGHTDPDDEAGRERIGELTREFLRRYHERQGSTLCTDILGHDLSQPGVAERVKAEGLSQEPCPAAVRAAAEILEDLL